MREKYSIIYACPKCHSALDIEKDVVISGEVREGRFFCAHDELQFPIKKGIPRLLLEENKAYEAVTTEVEEGGETHIIVEDPEYYKGLPYKSIKNKQEWELRRVNFEKLVSLLREDNKHRILDLGSGNCWLSNRLADYYEVFALDVNSGPTGLELSDIYFTKEKYFERVQGEPINLPLADKSFDVVICSAQLNHYNPEVVIAEITRVLRDNGVVYILDSQVYNTPEGVAKAREESKGTFAPLFKKDLDRALRNRYSVKYYYSDYGALWGLTRQVSSLLLRREYPSLPIIRAKKL